MLKKIALFVLLFLILSSFLILPFTSQAQAIPEHGQGLTISPPLSEFNLQPGQTYTQTLEITNPTLKVTEFYPVVMNFRAKGEGGEPAFFPAIEEEKGFSLANWLNFSKDRIILFPGQVLEWQYKIVVPTNAEPGGHYGVVFLATSPPEKNENVSQIGIASMLGSLILVKTPGDIREEASIKEFSSKRFNLNLPINFLIRIANSGNVHFKPVGAVTIKNWFGKEVGKVNVNEKQGNVLPQSTRKFEETWSPQISGFWSIPIGRFVANMNVSYGDSHKALDSRLVFWIIPLWLIILVTVIIVILIIWLIVKLIRRKK